MTDIDEAIGALEVLKKALKKIPDKKLSEAYQKAVKDYEETGDKKCKVASEIIKKEMDARNKVTDNR